MFYTATRTSQALGMQWDELNWGNWRYWKDDDGREHKALIWIPPRNRSKARDQEGGEKLPRRVLITGEALKVLERLRTIWELNHELPEHAHWNGVFTERMIERYLSARTDLQRDMEEKAGTKPWDRKALRHTHATYLGFLGCPPHLISLSMNHSARQKKTDSDTGEGADADRYNKADAAKRFMTTDPLAQLAPWHRLHKLVKDIERGIVSSDLAAIRTTCTMDGSAVTCDDAGVNRALIEVKPPRLTVVA
jgi:integrase